jgi:hypothetical protein
MTDYKTCPECEGRSKLMPEDQEPMICLSIVQAKVALECAENDITTTKFGEVPDYGDVGQMMFYMQRAELVQRLKNLLRACGEVV